MAEARVSYVGPGTKRLPSFPSGVPSNVPHPTAQPDGSLLGTRLASVESVVSAGDALKASPLPRLAPRARLPYLPRISNGLHDSIPLLFSATLEHPTAAMDEGTTFRCPESASSGRGSRASTETHSAILSSRRNLGTETVRIMDTWNRGSSVGRCSGLVAPFIYAFVSER